MFLFVVKNHKLPFLVCAKTAVLTNDSLFGIRLAWKPTFCQIILSIKSGFYNSGSDPVRLRLGLGSQAKAGFLIVVLFLDGSSWESALPALS